MKYNVQTTHRFEKSLEKCIKRGLDKERMKEVLGILAATGTLPPKYFPHKLVGNYAGCWACHIQPDWLLVWEKHEKELTLLLLNTGTHSELFNK